MLYVILVAAIIIFWLVAVDRPILLVQFKSGQITKHKGHFPATFRHNILDISKRTPFDGEVKVYQQRNGTKITFSKTIPKPTQQRIKNVFPHQSFSSNGRKRAR